MAAAKADQLGDKLLESGLRLDMRREEATRLLVDYCGPDANGEQAAAMAARWVTTCSSGSLSGTSRLACGRWVQRSADVLLPCNLARLAQTP